MIITFVRVEINSTSARPSRLALYSAKVLDRRQLRCKWLEIGALSPIADYATADYAAILDRGNLKGDEVLKELTRKSVVPA
jgi:hypothetical protein